LIALKDPDLLRRELDSRFLSSSLTPQMPPPPPLQFNSMHHGLSRSLTSSNDMLSHPDKMILSSSSNGNSNKPLSNDKMPMPNLTNEQHQNMLMNQFQEAKLLNYKFFQDCLNISRI